MTSRFKSRGTLPKQVHDRFHLLRLWVVDGWFWFIGTVPVAYQNVIRDCLAVRFNLCFAKF